MMNTMPAASFIPVLNYPDVPAAIDWLGQHFDFLERWRAGETRAQLSFGNGAIELIQGVSAGNKQSISLMVQVPDLQHHYERSHASGLSILQKPTTLPNGEKQYSLLDIGGHVWTFTQTVRELSPEDWGAVSARHFQ